MNYFPTYLATGKAFCNRKEELKRVIYDLEGNTPILLISPRRYGKTSLALKAFEHIQWPFTHIDLYKALSEEDIIRFVLAGIGKLLGKIETTPKKLLLLAKEFFGSMEIKVILEDVGLGLEFSHTKANGIDLMIKALDKLHEIAKKYKKRVIVFLDEFQIVGEIANNSAIEAALRESVQKSTQVTYVFSGSNRHLMEQMFYDKKRPFYKLCDQITLNRINSEEYATYIQIAAKKTWGKLISEKALNEIFVLTECHPYYVNKLCSLVWQSEHLPNEKMIYECWMQYALENKSVTERELELLTVNQRRLLMLLALGATKELYSKEKLKDLNLSQSSAHRALKDLLEKDYVYKDRDGSYNILDPLMKIILSI